MRTPSLRLAAAAVACFAASLSQASSLASRDINYFSFIPGYACYEAPTVVGNGAAFVPVRQSREPYGYGIAKLGPAGGFDASWGNAGLSILPETSGMYPVADGKYLTVGRQPIRLTSSGAIDPTYRGEDLPQLVLVSAATQADGSLVVQMHDGGSAAGDKREVFVRFLPDGRRDISFGTDGTMRIGADLAIYAWAVRQDGSLDLASYATAANGLINPTVKRFARGADPVVLSGRVIPEQGVANWLAGYVKIDGFGAALIASGGRAAAIWRFEADGSLDEGFDREGRRAAMEASPVGGIFHEEGPRTLWQAPGGGWIMPIFSRDRAGAGFFQTITNQKEPVILLDSAGNRTGVLDALVDDRKVIREFARLDDGAFLYHADFPDCNTSKAVGAPARVEATIIEYYSAQRDRYFITLDGAESATLDANPQFGWFRTGQAFGASMPVPQPGVEKVCRFYGDPVAGPDSHFYASEGFECDGLRSMEAQVPIGKGAWRFEGYAFGAADAIDGQCAGNLVPVYRVYNMGFGRGIPSNHRYTTDPAIYADMQKRGWGAEGVRFCVPPASAR